MRNFLLIFLLSGIVPGGKTFLEPLIQRDSAIVADPFAYGFVLKDTPKGATYALPDLSKGRSTAC